MCLSHVPHSCASPMRRVFRSRGGGIGRARHLLRAVAAVRVDRGAVAPLRALSPDRLRAGFGGGGTRMAGKSRTDPRLRSPSSARSKVLRRFVLESDRPGLPELASSLYNPCIATWLYIGERWIRKFLRNGVQRAARGRCSEFPAQTERSGSNGHRQARIDSTGPILAHRFGTLRSSIRPSPRARESHMNSTRIRIIRIRGE